jgi:hypothetical protein
MKQQNNKRKNSKIIRKSFTSLTTQSVNLKGIQKYRVDGAELKVHGKLLMNGVAISSAVQVFDLSDIPQGVGTGQRIGRTVRLKGVEVQGNIARADDTNNIRLILFTWHPNNTTAPTWNPDIISRGISTGITNPVDLYALYQQLYNPTAFTIHHDRIISVTLDKDQCPFRMAESFNHQVTFNTTALTGLHHLYLFVISDSGAVSHPVGDIVSQVFYTDE